MGNFPAKQGLYIGMAGLLFDLFDQGEADIASDRANLFVVNQVSPAQN